MAKTQRSPRVNLTICFSCSPEVINALRTNPTYSILNDVVHAYMEDIGEGHHEDVMRTFFRLRVGEIGNIIKKVVAITTEAALLTGRDIIEFLPEANRIVLVSPKTFRTSKPIDKFGHRLSYNLRLIIGSITSASMASNFQ